MANLGTKRKGEGASRHAKRKPKPETEGLADLMADAQGAFDTACDLLDSGAGFDQCASSLGAAIRKLEKCAVIKAKSGAEVEIEQSAQNPDYLLASALLELGKLREDRGDYGGARAEYVRAVAACPGSAGARHHLGKMLRVCANGEEDLGAAEGELEQAVAIATRVFELGSEGVYDPAFEAELAYGAMAQDDLAFLLCQQNRNQEARAHLKAKGYTWRLSRDVLHYPDASDGEQRITAAGAPTVLKQSKDYVQAVDGILPADWLGYMQAAFGKDSPFWTEHSYGPNTPYFSYLHKLGHREKSRLDAVIGYLHDQAVRHFPGAKRAKYAEWWAHCRPHAHGHQLHFDSDDEGRSRLGGKPRHPIISSVLYLSGGHVGGPTMVSDQVLGANLAAQGWLVTPKENRYCMFNGDVLHGVIPGRGHVEGGGTDERRVTFMVAFWEDIKATDTPDGGPGSAQSFPYAGSKRWQLKSYSWPSLHAAPGNKAAALVARDCARVCPVPLRSVWEEVRAKKGAGAGAGAGGAKQPKKLPSYEQCFQGF